MVVVLVSVDDVRELEVEVLVEVVLELEVLEELVVVGPLDPGKH